MPKLPSVAHSHSHLPFTPSIHASHSYFLFTPPIHASHSYFLSTPPIHTSHSHLPDYVIHTSLFTAAIPQGTRHSHLPFYVIHTSLFTAAIPHYSQLLFRRRRVLPSNLRARDAMFLALVHPQLLFTADIHTCYSHLHAYLSCSVIHTSLFTAYAVGDASYPPIFESAAR